jgi:epoxyqueuosine reductase QueG
MRAEPMHVSPLGLLIHPTEGLWRGYRGALAFAERLAVPPFRAAASACETCVARPCLSACPVGAFTGAGYDVAACAAHLGRPAGRACMAGACLARRACPVGADWAHEPAEAAFHMRAFLSARGSA